MRLGLLTSPSKSMIFHAHLHYASRQDYRQFLKIEFYSLLIGHNQSLSLIQEYSFPIKLSFSGTIGRVCQVRENYFTIAFGDLMNDLRYYFIACNENEILIPFQRYLACKSFTRDFLNQYYFIKNEKIIAARIIASDQSLLQIRLDNQVIGNRPFIEIRNYQLPFDHGFQQYTEIERVRIVDMAVYDGTVYYLLRFGIEEDVKSNETSKKRFAVDMIIDSQDNKVVSIFKIDDDPDFCISSSIAFDDEKRVPFIFWKFLY
jgi:hypothetical protein